MFAKDYCHPTFIKGTARHFPVISELQWLSLPDVQRHVVSLTPNAEEKLNWVHTANMPAFVSLPYAYCPPSPDAPLSNTYSFLVFEHVEHLALFKIAFSE